MTLDELAERTGEDVAALRHYVDLGLLVDTHDYTPADVERVRLVQILVRRGIKLDAIADALRGQSDLFDRYLAQLYPDGDYPSITIREAAERTGADVGLAERVWEAAGLGGPSELLTESDVAAAQSLTIAASLGFPEDALLQLVRVYADSMNRVGEAEQRLFHFYVHEPLRASGLTPDEPRDGDDTGRKSALESGRTRRAVLSSPRTRPCRARRPGAARRRGRRTASPERRDRPSAFGRRLHRSRVSPR